MQPHQQRVVTERTELAVKVTALGNFLGTETHFSLPKVEADLLVMQYSAMSQYLEILTQRSATYPPSSPDVTSQELAAAGKTAPRVTREQIEALMECVTYKTSVPEGTTTTFVHAFLDGEFFLATGFSACVSKENFIAATGQRIATEDAVKKATQKLWELEGYALRVQIQQANEA